MFKSSLRHRVSPGLVSRKKFKDWMWLRAAPFPGIHKAPSQSTAPQNVGKQTNETRNHTLTLSSQQAVSLEKMPEAELFRWEQEGSIGNCVLGRLRALATSQRI